MVWRILLTRIIHLMYTLTEIMHLTGFNSTPARTNSHPHAQGVRHATRHACQHLNAAVYFVLESMPWFSGHINIDQHLFSCHIGIYKTGHFLRSEKPVKDAL